MKITGQYIEDRFRTAEQIEIAEGNGEHLFGDIAAALDKEAIDEGFSLSFGGDRESLAGVLDVVGLDSLTHGEEASYNITQAICYDNGCCTGYVGKAIPALSRLSLVDAVETLQADDWVVEDREQYPYVRATNDVLTSTLIISAVSAESDKDGRKFINVDVPGFALTASFRYAPNFAWDDDFALSRGKDLAYFLEAKTKPYDDPGFGVIEIANEIFEPLQMPSANYYLAFGRLGYSAHYNPTGSINSVGIPYENRYLVKDRKLRPIPSEFDE